MWRDSERSSAAPFGAPHGMERSFASPGGAKAAARSAALASPKPSRLQLIDLPPGTRTADGLSVILALHAGAIAQNLQCVYGSIDPEGPHQLRVSLRRLRVAIQAFKPLLLKPGRHTVHARARDLGAIVGELRDADVIIDERLAPELTGASSSVLTRLNAWRDQVRGRVRARLAAGTALVFCADLREAAASGALLKRRLHTRTLLGAIAPFMQRTWERAAPLAKKMTELPQSGLHDLRKYAKSLRYGVELAGSVGERHPQIAHTLKRIQDILGLVNDASLLENFSPLPMGPDRARLAVICERLVSEQRANMSITLERAAHEWRALAREWPWDSASNSWR